MATTNTIAAGLKLDLVLDIIMRAFMNRILPVVGFSTAYRDVPLEGNDIMRVPYHPLDAGASTTFTAPYAFSGSTATQSKPITINKRKYQPLSYTSAEQSRQPYLNPTQLMVLKGEKLGDDILEDIFSVITFGNFGAAVIDQAAPTFDLDDAEDLKVICHEANWPMTGRSLVLDSSHYSYLIRDNRISSQANYGNNQAVQEGRVTTRIAGFTPYDVPRMPQNSEKLAGFASFPSSILIGFSPITPTEDVMRNLTAYKLITDPATGLTLEYRRWGDPNYDETRETIECNYGYAVGESAALKRITKP